MKIFICHVNLGCCSNNSDGKIWVVADNKDKAEEIARKYTVCPIFKTEEINIQNEVIYASFNDGVYYKLNAYKNNYGDLNSK